MREHLALFRGAPRRCVPDVTLRVLDDRISGAQGKDARASTSAEGGRSDDNPIFGPLGWGTKGCELLEDRTCAHVLETVATREGWDR